jgi:hypothetical protein
MIMQLNDSCMACDRTVTKGRDLDRFVKKYDCLTEDELADALTISTKELFHHLPESVPCVGCRRR